MCLPICVRLCLFFITFVIRSASHWRWRSRVPRKPSLASSSFFAAKGVQRRSVSTQSQSILILALIKKKGATPFFFWESLILLRAESSPGPPGVLKKNRVCIYMYIYIYIYIYVTRSTKQEIAKRNPEIAKSSLHRCPSQN